MSHAGWGELYHRALELYAAEPIELRLAIGLGLLLLLVLMLAGLRAALRPVPKPVPAMPTVAPVVPVTPVVPVAPVKPAVPLQQTAPIGTFKIQPRPRLRIVQPKTFKVHAKPFRNYRPRLRTTVAEKPKLMVTGEGAPFSPIPPIGE